MHTPLPKPPVCKSMVFNSNWGQSTSTDQWTLCGPRGSVVGQSAQRKTGIKRPGIKKKDIINLYRLFDFVLKDFLGLTFLPEVLYRAFNVWGVHKIIWNFSKFCKSLNNSNSNNLNTLLASSGKILWYFKLLKLNKSIFWYLTITQNYRDERCF